MQYTAPRLICTFSLHDALPISWRGFTAAVGTVTVLLDTHFLIWLVLQSKRLSKFTWLDRYRPWGVSPVSFLEIQFLARSEEHTSELQSQSNLVCCLLLEKKYNA